MAGVDYELATVSQREKFSFTKTMLQEIYNKLKQESGILGVAIISTCNRTEIYMSCEDEVDINPFELLCNAIFLELNACSGIYQICYGHEVVRHLCLLACGTKSQIWGEGQIITQVKNAIEIAREMQCTDSILEVLFRTAVTGAKKVRSLVAFKSTDDSTASKAVEIVKKDSTIRKVLVIGNGEIGRLVVELLVKSGYDATMTLRHYKHSQNIIPAGANTIDYIDRYEFMNECDAVISATLSPHHTVECEKVEQLDKKPVLFIDLAVPRDIEPTIGDLIGIGYYNVDDISKDEIEENHTKQLEEIKAILHKYIANFYNWNEYRTASSLVRN